MAHISFPALVEIFFKNCTFQTEAWRDQEKRGFVVKEDEVAALKSEQDVTVIPTPFFDKMIISNYIS